MDETGTSTSDAMDGEQLVFSRAELRRATLTGLRWVSLARLIAEILLFAASVILARLISPAEFGRAAVALIVVAVATVLIGQAFGAPLVQMRSLGRADLESATLLSLVTGFVLAAATLTFAWVVGTSLFGERISGLIQLSALAFVLVSLGTASNAVLQRNLNFRRLGMIEVASLTCGTITSVVLAFAAGLDAEALVAGALTSTATASLLSLASVPLPFPRWHIGAAREIASFGVPTALAALAYTAFRQVDYAILAVRLSATEVGLYWRAYQLGVEYQSKLTGIMLRIAFPVFSRTATLEDMRVVRARIVRLHATVLLPMLATFIALAPVLVPWLFGSAWKASVLPSQLLAVVGMGTAVVTGIGPLLLAAGKQRALLVYNLATLIVYAGTVFVAAPYGLTVVCLAVLAVQGINFLATHYILLERMLGIPMRRLWTDVAPGGAASLAAFLVAYSLTRALSGADLEATLILVLAGALAALAWLATVRILFPAAWGDVLLVRRAVLRRSLRP
jgi:lipopolysaccharide exporter